jgi:hypothetical protein
MKNVFKVLGVIALVAVIGFGFVSCGDDGGGSGDVTFNVTNNYSKKVVKIEIIDSSTDLGTDGIKNISIDVNGGTGTFKVKLKKFMDEEYMGRLFIHFEGEAEELYATYSYKDSKSTFNVTINTEGFCD